MPTGQQCVFVNVTWRDLYQSRARTFRWGITMCVSSTTAGLYIAIVYTLILVQFVVVSLPSVSAAVKP